jgi:hypothetical protein
MDFIRGWAEIIKRDLFFPGGNVGYSGGKISQGGEIFDNIIADILH